MSSHPLLWMTTDFLFSEKLSSLKSQTVRNVVVWNNISKNKTSHSCLEDWSHFHTQKSSLDFQSRGRASHELLDIAVDINLSFAVSKEGGLGWRETVPNWRRSLYSQPALLWAHWSVASFGFHLNSILQNLIIITIPPLFGENPRPLWSLNATGW